MLKMVKGVKVDCADRLFEGFEVDGNNIVANVDEDKILSLLKMFVIMQKDVMFLIIEVPSNYQNEKEQIKTHKDIYYADGLSSCDVLNILDKFGYLFVNDGMGQIGVGNHIDNSEIMTSKYNIVKVYSKKSDIDKYKKLFTNNCIGKVDNLLTAWDYFDNNSPGFCEIIEYNDKNIYDVINILKEKFGLYFFEQRDDF